METKQYKLQTFEVSFKKGYSFDNTSDRYEGKVKFENGEGESFVFNLTEEQTKPFLTLISNQVREAANELGNKLISLI